VNNYLPMTGHEAASIRSTMNHVYEYDRAADGPECEIITRIRSGHGDVYLAGERFDQTFFDKEFGRINYDFINPVGAIEDVDWGDLLV